MTGCFDEILKVIFISQMLFQNEKYTCVNFILTVVLYCVSISFMLQSFH